MGGKGQGFDQGVRRDIQRHGEGRDRRLDRAPGCPGARVPVDRGQAGLPRGDGQDTVRHAMVEGPTPIDHECESENLEDDVAAVSWSTQCFGCGGWGHLRRECPSQHRRRWTLHNITLLTHARRNVQQLLLNSQTYHFHTKWFVSRRNFATLRRWLLQVEYQFPFTGTVLCRPSQRLSSSFFAAETSMCLRILPDFLVDVQQHNELMRETPEW